MNDIGPPGKIVRGSPILCVVFLTTILVIGSDSPVQAAAPANGSPPYANSVLNYSFEGQGAWENHADGASPSGFVDSCGAFDGDSCLWIDDTESDESEGWRSEKIPVSPRAEYTASAMIYRESGQAPLLYLKYYNSSDSEIASAHIEAPSGYSAWQAASVTARAPSNASYARVVPYSIASRVGESYFDQIEFSRSSSQSLIDNQDFRDDSTGPGQPVSWSDWSPTGEPFSVDIDPTDGGNHTLRVEDDSTSNAGYAATQFDAWSGTKYVLTFNTYLESGSDRTHGYLKFFDAGGSQLASYSTASGSTQGTWQSVGVSGIAPEGTAYAKVLVGCIISFECTAHFDNIETWEDWTDTTLYVSPTGSGLEDGSSPSNAAVYSDGAFWDDVQTELSSSPVQVVWVDGTYEIDSDADVVQLEGLGSDEYRLSLSGESRYGAVLTVTDDIAPSTGVFRVDDSTRFNLSFLHFRVDLEGTIPALVVIMADDGYVTEDVWVRGITSRNNTEVTYSSISVRSWSTTEGQVSNVLIEDGEFIRAGYSAGYHHFYPSHRVDGLRIERNYLEDSAGSFIKLRSNMSNTSVSDNYLVLTSNWSSTYTPPFFVLAVYNATEPGVEWLGEGYVVADNTIRMPGSCGDCTVYNITHQGYNPVDDTMTERDHLLDSTKRDVLLDTSIGNIANRQGILDDDFHIVPDNCSTGVCVDGNLVVAGSGHKTFTLYTTHAYGAPSQGGSGVYDIGNLFTY